MKSTLFSLIAVVFTFSVSAQATHTIVYNTTSSLTCGIGDTLKLYGVTSGLVYEASTVSGGTLSISQIMPTTPVTAPYYIGYFVIQGNETDVLFIEHSNNGTKTIALNIFPTTGIIEATRSSYFQLHPNPVTDVLTITSAANKNVQLYSTDGKLILTFSCEAEAVKKDLSMLPKGIYLVKTENSFLRIIKE